ncbi:Hepatocyte growth factor-regulated tyrosine kinase substrate [Phytophthora citrophthora]|uniref:Hepatocyte growth factor-regulated tyrosine kinase substrate n=1 Tax=Phytophthora citrophthora TaxID=4793 RepID=A0AAD9FZV5_9STRA|nr:Hepatocyte growth factor-regulated tyrosine kinase substrate [Phytophthora citrophthora]
MSSALSLQPSPLTSAAFTRSVEEDLESQARASLSLFGFGSQDTVNWSPVSASAAAAAMSATENPGTGGAIKVRVMERVCPIGTNTFLWNTMNSLVNGGEGGDDPATSSEEPAANGNSNGTSVNGAWEGDTSDWEAASSAAGLSNVFASKVLQQYLVKCVALLPSSIEEVVDLLVRSDKEDMELPMQHLVGVRASSSAFVYRRKKKRQRRSNNNNNNGNASDGTSQRMASQASTQDCDSESSYSDSDLEVEDDLQPFTSFGRESARARATRGESLELDKSGGNATPTARATNAGLYLSPTYMEDYRTAMATSGNQGNLSIKWVVGEKSSRMFASRTTYCLLDYECILVNDWDENADPSPMYVRTMQSCYSSHCQPWLDEVGSKPTDLQPTGFMVRQARNRDGYVEIQFVASILEKAQLPMASRRAKLRALCAKIARLEEVLTSRRLSQSLLVNAPHWVHNRERLGCRICDAKFGLSRRRHHCRLCGEVCCSECCPKMDVALPDVGSTSVRVCIGCVQKRRKSCESSASSSSTAVLASTLSPTKGPCANTPPPPIHPTLRSAVSSPSDYYLSSSSSYGSTPNSFTTASSLGERKHSLASSVFQKMKSSSLS